MNAPSRIIASTPPGLDSHSPDVDSFYHLREGILAGHACDGTACFVARNSSGKAHPLRGCGDPRIYCLGRCFEAPATGPAPSRPHVKIATGEPVILRNIATGGATKLCIYRNSGGFHGLEKALSEPPERLLRAVEVSGLRGRGGAGFPTGAKWRAAAARNAFPKYVVANADEGDPGAYIDRFIMEDDPFLLIEGMTLAAYAIGAERGWIYLRGEYPRAKTILERAIAEARAAGLLGKSILGGGFDFDIEIHIGLGSYVCGEETAMLRSIQGVRPEVMARPPFATERGLFGQPTVGNNVETLAAIPWIAARGGDAYRALGFSHSRGTKVLSLNSLFAEPVLCEVEFGMSVREIVENLGGGLRSGATLKGVIIGGPLAGIIPPHLLDTPFGFEELNAIGACVGHGGVIAFDRRTSIPALVRHVFSFGAFESCGKCTPCRLGARSIEGLFDHPEDGKEDWERLVTVLKRTSLCGHGTGLAEFAESVMRHYGKELEEWFA